MPDTGGGFIWYELMTPDPEGAKAFYGPVVGWTMTTGHGDTDDYGFITRSDGGMNGGVLRLSKDMTDHGAKPCWMGYIHVADVDAAVRAIESAGGKCLMPARDIEMAGRIAMVADPQGAPFYVMKPTPPGDDPDAQSDVFSVDRPQHVRWNELTATDDAAAFDFYAKQFGWTKAGAMPMGEMGDYSFIAHEGTTIGALMRGSAPDWRYYIGVADIDAAIAATKSGGGTVLDGPHEIPGGEFSLHGRDPQGADFGLVGPRKG